MKATVSRLKDILHKVIWLWAKKRGRTKLSLKKRKYNYPALAQSTKLPLKPSKRPLAGGIEIGRLLAM
jgi:hypothetical protein